MNRQKNQNFCQIQPYFVKEVKYEQSVIACITLLLVRKQFSMRCKLLRPDVAYSLLPCFLKMPRNKRILAF